MAYLTPVVGIGGGELGGGEAEEEEEERGEGSWLKVFTVVAIGTS